MREIEIERLVQWAYRDELPKRSIGNVANSYEPVMRFGEYLTVIDDEPGFPVIMGPPHQDALTIERAVQGLAQEVTFDWRSNRAQLMGDLPMLAANVEDPFVVAPASERGHAVNVNGGHATIMRGDATPMRLRVFSEVALVEHYARMGRRPQWNVGIPGPQRMLGKNNKPVLIGECKDTGRYTEGSRCPLQYVGPTIEQLVHRRAEYLIWQSALVSLTGILLAWTLTDHIPLKPDASVAPWFEALDAAVLLKDDPFGTVARVGRLWQDTARVSYA